MRGSSALSVGVLLVVAAVLALMALTHVGREADGNSDPGPTTVVSAGVYKPQGMKPWTTVAPSTTTTSKQRSTTTKPAGARTTINSPPTAATSD